MVEFFLAAAIFGFSAVYVVPMVSKLLSNFVPTNYASYLPGTTTPAFALSTAVQALVFGVILAAILIALRKVGIKAATKGVAA